MSSIAACGWPWVLAQRAEHLLAVRLDSWFQFSFLVETVLFENEAQTFGN